MPAAELKPLLKLSRRRPVSCVIAITKDKQGVVLLDRRKKPRKLMSELRRQAAAAGVELNATSIRFGRVAVDGASDGTLVRFTVNKEAPGAMRMALLEQLRPAGFQRCEIVVDESLETESEDGEDEDTDDEDALGEAAAPAGNGAPPPAVPVFPAMAATAGGSAGAAGVGPVPGGSPDAAALTADLLNLARRIAPVIAADPARKEPLLSLATGTRDSIKAGNLQVAEAGVTALRQALQQPGMASPANASPGRDGLQHPEPGRQEAADPLAAGAAPGEGDLPTPMLPEAEQDGSDGEQPSALSGGARLQLASYSPDPEPPRRPQQKPAATKPVYTRFEVLVPQDCETLEQMYRLFERKAYGREMNLSWNPGSYRDMAKNRGRKVPFLVPASEVTRHRAEAQAQAQAEIAARDARAAPSSMQDATAGAWRGLDERSIAGMSEQDRYDLARRKTADVTAAQLKFMADHPGATAADFAKSAALLNTPQVLAAARKDINEALDGDANAWARIGAAAGGGAKISGWLLAVAGVVYVASFATGVGELATIAVAATALLATTVTLSLAESEARIKAASQATTPDEFERNVDAAAAARANVIVAVAMIVAIKITLILAKVPFKAALEYVKESLKQLRKRMRAGEALDAIRPDALKAMAASKAKLAAALASAKDLAAKEAAGLDAMTVEQFAAEMERNGGVADQSALPADQKVHFGELMKTPEGRTAVGTYKQRLVAALRTDVVAGLESRFRQYDAVVDGFLSEAGRARSVEALAAAATKLEEFLGEPHTRELLQSEQNKLVQQQVERASGEARQELAQRAAKAQKGLFVSGDPIVAEVANGIEAAYRGLVKAVNVVVHRPDGSVLTDIDIQLDGTSIQVKTGGGKGMTKQMVETQRFTGQRTIAYGPDLGPTLVKNLRRMGFEVYTTEAELIKALKGLK